jgi:hypothetical protein
MEAHFEIAFCQHLGERGGEFLKELKIKPVCDLESWNLWP